MKHLFITIAVMLVFVPAISQAKSTISGLEEQRIQLLEQIIVLLKSHLEHLFANRGVILTPSITSITSSATTTTVIKKKRSGGGGGSSAAAQTPLVLSMTADGNNFFTVTANQQLDPRSIIVTGLDIAMDVWEYISEIPSSLTLRARLNDGSYHNIALVLDLGLHRYTADMRALLPQGVNFTGEFEILVPEFFQPVYIEYSVFIETNGVTRTIVLHNDGVPVVLVSNLELTSSTEDPDPTIFGLDEDSNVEEMIFAFDLSAEDSDNDINLYEIVIDVTIGGPALNIDNLINDFRIEIDGQSFDAESYTGTSSTTKIIFSIDGDLAISADEVVTAMLYADFENMNNSDNEGSTISASVSTTSIDTEEDIVVNGITIESGTHVLQTRGVFVETSDTNARMTVIDGTDDDYATYSIEIEVTAFEQDVYISTSPATSITYTVEDGASVATTSGSKTVTITSTGDEVSGTFEITEGSTETLTIEVTYDPAVTTSSAARVQLETLIFGSTSGTPTGQSWTASPRADYRTPTVTIVD